MNPIVGLVVGGLGLIFLVCGLAFADHGMTHDKQTVATVTRIGEPNCLVDSDYHEREDSDGNVIESWYTYSKRCTWEIAYNYLELGSGFTVTTYGRDFYYHSDAAYDLPTGPNYRIGKTFPVTYNSDHPRDHARTTLAQEQRAREMARYAVNIGKWMTIGGVAWIVVAFAMLGVDWWTGRRNDGMVCELTPVD